MMDETEFRRFLKRGGRSPAATDRACRLVGDYERYLQTERGGTSLGDADLDDLNGYVDYVESEPKKSAKSHLWAIRYYYEFEDNESMRAVAGQLREQRIERKAFSLAEFRGVNAEYIERLKAIGIRDVEQMLAAGSTPAKRKRLAEKAEVPEDAIVELVKLSDLARIPGVKGIRARLYYDAGVDTVEKLAEWEPEALREMTIEFVERTEFDGVAPLYEEARFTVEKARSLPTVIS